MSYRETEHLRVLIANERKDRLALVAPIVVAPGHEVIAREIEVKDVGAVTARERPDVALGGLGESSQHALELIDKTVREAACPVIVLLYAWNPEFIQKASKRVEDSSGRGRARSGGRACRGAPRWRRVPRRGAAEPPPPARQVARRRR